jgi:hypothetical protein
VAHVDHHAVDAVVRLVVGDDLGDLVPQRLHDVLGARELGGIHADGVVADVVEIGVVVEPQVGDVGPRRLLGVRAPVAEGAGDADGDGLAVAGIGGGAAPAAVFHADGVGRGRGGEHVAVDLVRREQLVEAAVADGVVDVLEFVGGEDRRAVGVFGFLAVLAVGDVGADPVEPLGVLLGPGGVLGGGAEDEFDDDADAEVVRGFDEGGEFGFRVEAEGGFGEMLVERVGIADGEGAAHVALVAVLADGGDGEQVDGVAAERADEREHRDRLEEGAGLAPAGGEGLAGDVAVAVVVEGRAVADEEVVGDGVLAPVAGDVAIGDACAGRPGFESHT